MLCVTHMVTLAQAHPHFCSLLSPSEVPLQGSRMSQILYLRPSHLQTSVLADHLDKNFAKCLVFLGGKWFLKALA